MNENITTIVENYSLPSKGQVYAKLIDPEVKLRSMTTAEEMKRLAVTDKPYEQMSSIIEDCLIKKLGMPVYDLCLGDYQYLLHKLRVVTYGPEYKVSVVCPICGEVFEHTINLDELKVLEYKPELQEKFKLTLPKTGHKIEFRLQTPRDLDRIDNRKAEMKKQFPDMVGDPTIILSIISVLKSIDGDPINPFTAEEFIKKLPMRDTNKLLKVSGEIQDAIGVETSIPCECPHCKSKIKTPFRFTSEFFRPEDD